MRTIGGNVMDVDMLDRLASSTSTSSGHGIAGVAGGVVAGLPPAAPRGVAFRPGRISITDQRRRTGAAAHRSRC